MIQIQNVTFFPEKNMILISRGAKQTWISKTQGGSIVVKIKGWDQYWYDPETWEVFSRKGSGGFAQLKKNTEEKRFYYWFHRNGHRTKVYLRQILSENLEGIEAFVNDKISGKTHLKLL